VTEFGGGIDPFKVDLLQSHSLGVGDKRFTEGKDSFLGSNTTSFQHDEVVLDLTIMREASHRCDRFVGKISFGSSVVLDQFSAILVDTLTDSVDLLVDLATMMVTLLT